MRDRAVVKTKRLLDAGTHDLAHALIAAAAEMAEWRDLNRELMEAELDRDVQDVAAEAAEVRRAGRLN